MSRCRVDIDQVQNSTDSSKLTTQNGTEIEFDAYFFGVAGKPNTDVIKSSVPIWLDEKVLVKVNKNLQVSMGRC